MRAAVLTGHGGAEVVEYVEDLPVPEPGAGEVRIKIAAAALNRLDLWVRAGWRGLELDFPHVVCADGAGVVDAVGEGVTGFAPGDRVCIDPTIVRPMIRRCTAGWRTRRNIAIWASITAARRPKYIVLPAAQSDEDARRFRLRRGGGGRAGRRDRLAFADHARGCKAGESVLIVGAGGGVNSISIQIAKLAGATVYASAAMPRNARRRKRSAPM